MRFHLDLAFKDHESDDPEENDGYYEGYDVTLGGYPLMFYPYDGSSWEEAVEEIIHALGQVLTVQMDLRKPRKVSW